MRESSSPKGCDYLFLEATATIGFIVRLYYEKLNSSIMYQISDPTSCRGRSRLNSTLNFVASLYMPKNGCVAKPMTPTIVRKTAILNLKDTGDHLDSPAVGLNNILASPFAHPLKKPFTPSFLAHL